MRRVRRASSTPAAKLERIQGTVHLVDGSRGDVAAAAVDHVEATGAFYASHVWNPWFFEGTKHYRARGARSARPCAGRTGAAVRQRHTRARCVASATGTRRRVPIVAVEARPCATVAAGIGIAFAVRETEVHDIVRGEQVARGRRSPTRSSPMPSTTLPTQVSRSNRPRPFRSRPLSAVDGETIVLPISSGARTH